MTIDGDRIPVIVPVGASLFVTGLPLVQETNAFVEGAWEKRRLLMFLRDVRERATRVQSDESEES